MQPSTQTKNGTFWNSHLGLFILSAVFLTFLPFLYTNIQDFITQRKEETHQSTKITAEINHRLNTIKMLTTDNLRPYQITDIRLATFGIRENLKPDYYNFTSIFSDYRNMTLLSLITQLNTITHQAHLKTANRQLAIASAQIKPTIDLLMLNPDNRQKVILNATQWTLEYSLPDSLKNEINNTLIAEVEKWQEIWP